MKRIMAGGKEIRISGRWLRMAELEGDGYEFLDNPEPMIELLRRCGTRIDLFTFMQRLPASTPKYSYLMEKDNLAAVPVSTFDNWWTKQVRPESRNRVRQAEKKCLTVREVPFGEELVKGICEIYNKSPIRQR